MWAYIDQQLFSNDQPEFGRIYPGLDGKKIIITMSQQFRPDTIDYVGRERFDELTGIESVVRETTVVAD